MQFSASRRSPLYMFRTVQTCEEFDTSRLILNIHLSKQELFTVLNSNLSSRGVATSGICDITTGLQPITFHFVTETSCVGVKPGNLRHPVHLLNLRTDFSKTSADQQKKNICRFRV